MGHGGAEHRIDVGALLVDHGLKHHALVGGDHLLGSGDEGVERLVLLAALGMLVAEPDEHGDHLPQLAHEPTQALLEMLPDEGEQPFPGGDRVGKIGIEGGFRSGSLGHRFDEMAHRSVFRDGPQLALIGQGGGHRWADRDLAGSEQARLGHQRGDDLAGEDIHVAVSGPAHPHPVGGARGDRGLDVEGLPPIPLLGLAELPEDGDQLQADCGGPGAVVVGEPAHHRVPSERDDAAVLAVDGGGDRPEHPVEQSGQLLGPATRSQCATQLLGDPGEAGNVGEEHRSLGQVPRPGPVPPARACDPSGDRPQTTALHRGVQLIATRKPLVATECTEAMAPTPGWRWRLTRPRASSPAQQLLIPARLARSQ